MSARLPACRSGGESHLHQLIGGKTIKIFSTCKQLWINLSNIYRPVRVFVMAITAWLLNVRASAWEDNQVKWMLQVYYLAWESNQQYGSAGRETSVLGGTDSCSRNKLHHRTPQRLGLQWPLPLLLTVCLIESSSAKGEGKRAGVWCGINKAQDRNLHEVWSTATREAVPFTQDRGSIHGEAGRENPWTEQGKKGRGQSRLLPHCPQARDQATRATVKQGVSWLSAWCQSLHPAWQHGHGGTRSRDLGIKPAARELPVGQSSGCCCPNSSYSQPHTGSQGTAGITKTTLPPLLGALLATPRVLSSSERQPGRVVPCSSCSRPAPLNCRRGVGCSEAGSGQRRARAVCVCSLHLLGRTTDTAQLWCSHRVFKSRNPKSPSGNTQCWMGEIRNRTCAFHATPCSLSIWSSSTLLSRPPPEEGLPRPPPALSSPAAPHLCSDRSCSKAVRNIQPQLPTAKNTEWCCLPTEGE